MATQREIQGPRMQALVTLTRSTRSVVIALPRLNSSAYIGDPVSETLRAPSHGRAHRNAKDRSR